jgi:hypothetical protein
MAVLVLFARGANKVAVGLTPPRSGMVAIEKSGRGWAFWCWLRAKPKECDDVRWSSDHGRSHDN